MGHEASSPHGKEFICKLKTGEVIKYNLMELKNRDAFSPEPSEEDSTFNSTQYCPTSFAVYKRLHFQYPRRLRL